VSCVFCGSTPITKEHVWPQWLQKVFPGHEKGTSILAKDVGEMAAPKVWAGKMFDATVGVVCESCNNGWMNDTENDAKPYVSLMGPGKQEVKLDPEAQRKVATWCVLRTFMHQFTAEPYVPDAHLKEAFATKQAPHQTMVWLAAYVQPGELTTYRGKAAEVATGPLPKGTKVYQALLSVGNMAFLVFGHQQPGTFVLQPGQFEGALIRIWPPEKSVVRWPPKLGLGPEGMELLSKSMDGG
jgi:hypothetical protein